MKKRTPGGRRWYSVCIVVSVLSASGALADEISTSYGPDTVSMLLGAAFPAKAEGTLGHGATASGIFGHEFSPHWLGEVNLQGSIFETGVTAGTDYYQQVLTLDAVYQLRDRRNGLVTPFVLAGIGPLRNDYYPSSRDGLGAAAELGLGLVTQPLFSDRIRFRVDARYVRDFREGGHSEPRVVAGIEIPLGRSERRVIQPAPVPIHEATRDVLPRPAPAPHIVRDSDGDGVDDDHDQCPDTLKGMRVDAKGCAVVNQVYNLAGVNFNFNESRLTTGAGQILDRVSLAFMGQPTLHVEIAGHTDSVGSQKANLLLSQRRAEAVKKYLLERGARAEQMLAHGYGKSQLLVDPEHSAMDAEHNRRVELRVISP